MLSSYLCSFPNKSVTVPLASSTITLIAAISQFLCSVLGKIEHVNSPEATHKHYLIMLPKLTKYSSNVSIQNWVIVSFQLSEPQVHSNV